MTDKHNELPADKGGSEGESADTTENRSTGSAEGATADRAPGGGPPGGGDDSGGGFFASNPGWAWALVGLLVVSLTVLAVLLMSGDDDDDATAITTIPEPTTTTSDLETTTTTVAETTTTVPETTTTTTVAETTTTAPAGGVEVESSPLFALLGDDFPPYGDVEVVEPGSVEAQWYQWDDLFVILYRGVSSEASLCLGNSAFHGNTFDYITNSELGDDDSCRGATGDQLAGDDFGVRTCGELVYYLTEIPTELSGDLFGTVELWAAADDVSGVSGVVDTDLGEVPEFDPAAPGYVLPASDLDDLIEVACG